MMVSYSLSITHLLHTETLWHFYNIIQWDYDNLYVQIAFVTQWVQIVCNVVNVKLKNNKIILLLLFLELIFHLLHDCTISYFKIDIIWQYFYLLFLQCIY